MSGWLNTPDQQLMPYYRHKFELSVVFSGKEAHIVAKYWQKPGRIVQECQEFQAYHQKSTPAPLHPGVGQLGYCSTFTLTFPALFLAMCSCLS